MADESARHRLFRKLGEVLGEQEAATLMEHLHPDRWDELATKADLEGLASKTDLEGLASKTDLEGLASKTDLEGLASKTDLEGLASKTDLEGLASDVNGLHHRLETLNGTVGGLGSRLEALTSRMETLPSRIETEARFAAVHERIDGSEHRVLGAVRGEMNGLVTAQTRTLVLALVGAVTANAMLVLAAVRLA